MSKQQLLEQVRMLQAQISTSSDSTAQELELYKIELEMQNLELRKAQHQLEKTRDFYADLYHFAPINYIALDEKGIVDNINLAGTVMLGQGRAKIVGQPFSKWVLQADVNRFYSHLCTALQSDKKVVDELRLRCPSGQQYDVRIESLCSRGAIYSPLLCHSIILNATEYNRTKNESILQARQLKLVTDALPLLIAYIDENERHLFANKMYADWFCAASKKIVGLSASEAWGKNNYLMISPYLKISLSGKQVIIDMELSIGENKKKSVNITLVPDFDRDKHVCGVITLIGDTTDKLAVEEVDRKRLLDAAHISRLTSMGEMASEIAHELNQPLAAISIYSDACRRMIVSGKGGQDNIIQSLIDISGQAERAGAVIRRIREFASKKELSFAKTDINLLVLDVMQLLAVELRLHNVRMNLSLEDCLPLVCVDKILIEQVIFNLARNAIEAMNSIDDSQRILQINTSASRINEIEISVEDSGPGLPAEQIKKIFAPFHTTKDDGMGMGLAISKSIVNAHQGRLWAVSNEPEGTIFSFTVPIESREEDSAT